MGISFSTSGDTFTASPNPRTDSATPVIWCNSLASTPLEAIGNTSNGVVLTGITHGLVRQGLYVKGPDLNMTWGSQDSLITNAAEDADKVVLIGISHGAACALHWACNNASRVAAIVGLIPALDLDYLYENNTGGFRATMEAAWSVTHPNPLPAGANSFDRTDDLQGLPIRLYAASDDTISTGIDVFSEATNASVVDLGALGHTTAALAQIDVDDLVNWVLTNI